jgi:Tol biopolymer transport system component
LEKDPAQRFQSARDVGFALDAVRTTTGGTAPVGAGQARFSRRRLGVILFVAVGVLAGVTAGFAAGRRRGMTASALPDVEPITFRWGTVSGARFLPDGRVVFSAAFEGRPEELFVRSSSSPTPQGLGLRDVRLLAASRTGELAVLLHPRVSVHWTAWQGTLASVPSVGGTPRELAENVEDADWSPSGDLAVVSQSGASRILESPPGHALFRTEGWISSPRFSTKGDLIGFLHHPVYGDDMGEVMVTDLKGTVRTLSQRWPTTQGLAWSADGSEIWFGAGRYRSNVVSALSLDGKARDVYRSVSRIVIEDVRKDGEVLINDTLTRGEIVYAGDGSGAQTLLSWTDFNYRLAALSADGRVLFSALQTVSTSEGLQPSWAILRKTDGAPAQVLGEGIAMDLSPDGRWALVTSADYKKLTALPTGVGQSRSIASGGLEMRSGAVRWMPDGKEVLVIGQAQGDHHAKLYRLAGDASGPTRISDASLSIRSPLHVSRDGSWAAALNEDRQLVVISVQDGATRPVPQIASDIQNLASTMDPGTAFPCAWSPDGSLWVAERVSNGARWRLLRLASRTGQLLEERNIGPADPSGTIAIGGAVLSPDGRQVAFVYYRNLGSLVILRGLASAAN